MRGVNDLVVGAIAGQVGGEIAEQAVKEGIQQTTKQIITEGLEKIPKESLQQTFGRQIPRSYLNSTGDALTKSGAERYYRTSIRAIIREGGANGPEQAIEATVKALGVSRAQAADIVVGNLGIALTRQGADEAVQAALKASGRSLKEIICATPSVIRGFLGSVYDNAIRLGRNPRQALRDTKKLSQSIAFQRAKMTLGWSVGASVVMILGYNAWQVGTGLFDRTKPEKTKEQAEQEMDEISGQSAPAIIGQSVMGLTAIGIGGVALLGVLTMGGNKDKAVAAAEDDEEDDDQMDRMIGNVLDQMREEGMAIGPVQRIEMSEILTEAERAEICDLARLFFEDNEDEIREALANRSNIMWVSWWDRRNPFLDKTRYPHRLGDRKPGGIKHWSGRSHFQDCLQDLINRRLASRDP